MEILQTKGFSKPLTKPSHSKPTRIIKTFNPRREAAKRRADTIVFSIFEKDRESVNLFPGEQPQLYFSKVQDDSHRTATDDSSGGW